MESSRIHKRKRKDPLVNANILNDLIQVKNTRVKNQSLLSFLFYSIGLCINLFFVINLFPWRFRDHREIIYENTIPDIEVEEEVIDDIFILVEQQPDPYGGIRALKWKSGKQGGVPGRIKLIIPVLYNLVTI